jgi:catecholate siderophore receptor
LNNTVHIPGFTRVDGAVYYTLPTFIGGGNARLAVNVENLFNKKYFPTVDGDNNISPGGPITAKLTLSATF